MFEHKTNRNLVKRIKCRAITLKLEVIDMLRSLHYAIHPALALFLLDVNRKTAYHSQYKKVYWK